MVAPVRLLARPRFFVPLLLIALTFLAGLHIKTTLSSIPSHTRQNWVLSVTPYWSHLYVKPLFPTFDESIDEPPEFVPALLDAPWAGSWSLAKLTRPQYKLVRDKNGSLREELASPAWLKLHIFSTPTPASRARRNLIRTYSLLEAIPHRFRHLIEVKFVLGRTVVTREDFASAAAAESSEKEVWEEEMMIEQEQGDYGDLLRLDGLWHGENMNQGKTMDWVERVSGGEGEEREAWWVLKCDDDTFPIMPNLLSFLARSNPHVPTYVGTTLEHWVGYHSYFQGMLYGFSWGVVKTIASADIPDEFRHRPWDEDARMGELMYSLPSKPPCDTTDDLSSLFPDPRSLRSRRLLPPLPPPTSSCLSSPIPPSTPPPGGWSATPLSPDPRSGLVRLDLGRKMGAASHWWIDKSSGAIAWHGLKSEEEYVHSYDLAHKLFEQAGRAYMWDPPAWMENLAEEEEGDLDLTSI